MTTAIDYVYGTDFREHFKSYAISRVFLAGGFEVTVRKVPDPSAPPSHIWDPWSPDKWEIFSEVHPEKLYLTEEKLCYTRDTIWTQYLLSKLASGTKPYNTVRYLNAEGKVLFNDSIKNLESHEVITRALADSHKTEITVELHYVDPQTNWKLFVWDSQSFYACARARTLEEAFQEVERTSGLFAGFLTAYPYKVYEGDQAYGFYAGPFNFSMPAL